MSTPGGGLLVKVIVATYPIFLVSILGAITWSIRTAGSKPIRAVVTPVICATLFYYIFVNLPLVVEPTMNQNSPIPEHHVENARKLTQRFRVADLHCDVLLWVGRDFSRVVTHPFDKKQTLGHVDLPRLRRGNVVIQVFAIVNSVPKDHNLERNAAPTIWSDSITKKAIIEGWSLRSWFSPKHRVLFAARRLHEVAARFPSELSVVRTLHDLPSLEDENDSGKVHGILAVEGLSSLDSDLANVEKFYDAGVRIMGLTHLSDTEVGGSLSGECQCGLSDFGRKAVQKMKELGIIIDLTHAHPKLMNDVMDLPESERPALMISHTGVNGVCNNTRNMDDVLLRRVADLGGIIGATLFRPALCGEDLIDSFVSTVKHIVSVTGNVKAVALGSDWDGAILVAVTADQTSILAGALFSGGFSSEEVGFIMFGNALKFFSRSLP